MRRIIISLLSLALVAAANAQVWIMSPSGGGQVQSGPPVLSCTQATTFLARTSSFTQAQKNTYSNAICSLVNSGTFAKLDALYILAAPNQAASLLNLVSTSFSLTINATMTFGANAGWMGDASTGYLNTNFTPSTAGGHYAVGSASLGVFITDPRQNIESWSAMGVLDSTFTYSATLSPLTAGQPTNSICGIGTGTNSGDSTVTSAQGLWVCNQTGGAAGTQSLYHNTTDLNDQTADSSTIPDGPIVIGGFNLAGGGGIVANSGDTFAFAFIGSGLTSTDINALSNVFNNFPISNIPAAAIARGFTTNKFSYNFATQGLSGIDINATLNPGFSIYTANWLGARTPAFAGVIAPPSSAFSFSPGVAVNVGGAVLSTQANTSSAFTATVAGTTMTVSALLYGPITAGQTVVGSSSLSGQTIVKQLTGTTGGVGTYQLSGSATIASPTNLLGNSYAAGVAPLFTAGGYYELEMSFTTPGSPSGFPSFWMQDINGLLNQNLNPGYGAASHFEEIDIFEAFAANDTNVLDWTISNGVSYNNNQASWVHQAYPSITNPAAAHLYGMLWVPSAQNAGVGLIQFFLDRTHIAGQDVSYSATTGSTPGSTTDNFVTPSNPNGVQFISESGQYVLLMQSGGVGYPAAMSNVNVWH